MNLGDMQTRVKSEIGLSSTAEVTLITGWCNDAVVQFLKATKCHIEPFTMALTAGQQDYDLPSSMLAFKELYIVPGDGSTNRLLEVLSTDEVLDRRRFPAGGFQPLGYSVEGWDLLMLSSKAVSSSDTLNGLYVPRPTPMASATDDPSTDTFGGIPTEYHETVVQYVLWKAAVWDDDIGASMGQGTRRFVMIGAAYQQNWEQGLRQAKMEVNRRGGIRWAPARPGGRRRRRFVPPTPGTDTGR